MYICICIYVYICIYIYTYIHGRKELCKGGDQPGRWIKLNITSENNITPCASWACEGHSSALSQLNDLFSFNNNYVWAPWKCIYKIYTPHEFKQCAIKQNIDSIKILGDSLAREHFQNLVMMLSNSDHMVLPKLLSSGGFSLPISKDFLLNISFDHFSAVLQEHLRQKYDLNRLEKKSHTAGINLCVIMFTVHICMYRHMCMKTDTYISICINGHIYMHVRQKYDMSRLENKSQSAGTDTKISLLTVLSITPS
jgi:hypothetical protein